MNTISMNAFTTGADHDQTSRTGPRVEFREPPLAVQILSIIAFGAFSIVAVSIAFANFWPAGFALALMIAWTWSRSRTFGGRGFGDHHHANMPKVGDLTPEVKPRGSGNASFDAYREETLQRLEEESREFTDFLARLRHARDELEFEKFMNDRALKARSTNPDDLGHEAA